MKNTRKIRLLAFILTLCLILGALPLYVFADGTETELPEQITETTNENLTAFQLGLGEKSVAELENMTLSAADIPASISRETVEAKDHVLRLREQEADLNTVIFQNRDGGKTVYLFGSPVKYVDANGNIRDKSTTLVSENVTVNGKTYAHSATDNFFGQYYPTMPQNGVMLAFGPYTVEMKPVITGVLTLRDTVVSDNKVTYNKVFGTGTSLVYTPTLNGVKEDIILSAYTGKSSFSFTIKTNGLAIIQNENDTFLADFEGNKVASLGDVIITDSANHTAYGTMTVVTKIEREEYTVTVNAPTAFLTSSTTVYPVTVDPTLFIYELDSEEMGEDGSALCAIEDLCIYNGYEDPYHNGTAYIGNYYYSGESDAEPEISRMLYRITEPAVDSNNLRQLISSPNLYSVKLHVYGGCYELSVDVVALPYESGWTNGDSQHVSSLPYIEYDSEYFATTTISNTSAQFIDIDITDAINSYDNSEETISSVGFMLKVIGEGGEDTECYNQIFIHQTENIGNNLYIAFDYDTFAGEYYVNNKITGHFLKGTNVNANISTGSYVSDNSIKWRLVYAGEGKYYIISKNIMGAYAYETGGTMKMRTAPTISSNVYKWIITEGADGEYTIKNASTPNYVNGALDDTTFINNYTSDYAIWRFCKVNDYVNLSSFSIEDLIMNVGETLTPTITKTPSHATWANASDFTWSSSNTEVASISNSGTITTSGTGGKSVITVKHKASGKQIFFDVVVRVLEDGIYHVRDSQNDGIYMFADSTEFVQGYDKVNFGYSSDTAGKYLWGFKMLEDGTYKITSLYFQTAEDTDNMALTYYDTSDPNSYDLELSEYDGDEDKKWIITYTNGNYLLSPQTNDDAKIVLDNENGYLAIGLVQSMLPTKSYWNGTYGTHTAGEVLNIAIEVDEDVIDAVFPNAVNATQLFYSAIDKWNGKSEYIRIYLPNETAPEGAYTVRFIEEDITEVNDSLFGKTKGYLNGVLCEKDDNWGECIISLDSYAMERAELTFTEIQQVITHEMGHALKLSHPYQITVNYVVLSVMNTRAENSYELRIANEPTTYDIYFLNEKWG